MKQLLLCLLVVGAIPAVAQESVADAARNSKQKQTVAKRVVTDDDMPSTSAASSVASATAVDLGGSWEADLNRVRAAYRQLCSDPTLHDAKSLPAAKQQFLEEAMAPLRARIAREEDQMKLVKVHFERLTGEEQTEIATAGTDKQKVAEIHERYAQLRKIDQDKVAMTMQLATAVYKEMAAIASECAQASK